MTIDIGDRYFIKPPLIFSNRDYEKGNPVAERFAYSSDKNSDWLDGAALLALLRQKSS
jgi:hypothetical protein